MSYARTDGHSIGVVGDRTQLRQPADIDQQARGSYAQVHHRDQRLAPGDHPRRAPVLREQVDGLRQAARPHVIDGGRFHD